MFLGILCALFALALLVLPAWRVNQGLLTPKRAKGLWISGCGFVVLAGCAFRLFGDLTIPAVLVGVTLAATGNHVQRKNTAPGTDA